MTISRLSRGKSIGYLQQYDHEAILRLFMECASDFAALIVDRKGRIIRWTAGAERLFGYAAEEIVGRRITQLYTRTPAASADGLRRCFISVATMKRGGGWWRRKDRSRFWGKCVCTRKSGPPGLAGGLAILIQDITTLAQAEEEERILSSIIENSQDAIITKDINGKMLKWNKAAERMFGYRESEMIGKPVALLIPPDRIKEERPILQQLRRGKRVEHYETVRVRKDGRLIEVSISVSPIYGSDGEIIGACKIARDITKRKQAEEVRRKNEQMLQSIMDTASDPIITLNERGLIQSANGATQQLFGYSAAELLGQNVNRLMPRSSQIEQDGYLLSYRNRGQSKIVGIDREVMGRRKDGSTFPMHLAVSEVKLKNQRLFAGIVHDLSGRRQLERQIMEITTNEQRRIGQDLHDGLCQDLVGIAFGIDAAARIFPQRSDGRALAKLAASVREVADQARQLAHGLNPVDFKAGGLSVALENLTAKITDSFGIDCTFHWDRIAEVCDGPTATHLYRIAQEATNNAIRHGKATAVEISLSDQGGAVVLSVIDNGKGVPESTVNSVKQGLALGGLEKRPTVGMGLQSMHYRARISGGTFTISPRKGGGTDVSCTIGAERFPPRNRLQKTQKISRAISVIGVKGSGRP